MKNLRSIIFDLDGTLIDSSEGVVDAVNYSLRQMGQAERSPEKIKPFIGYPLSKMYPEFTDAPLKELYRHFQVRAAQVMEAKTVPLAGAEAVLRQMHSAGFRLAIASTKIRLHIDSILAELGWSEMIEIAVGGDEVAQVKPAPDAFQKALDLLGVRPEEAVVVGDTINDTLAARAVPVKCVAVASPYGGLEALKQSSPDFFIERISDLPGLIAGNFQPKGPTR